MIIGRRIVERRKKNDFRLAGARKKTGGGELRLSESPVNPSEKADIFPLPKFSDDWQQKERIKISNRKREKRTMLVRCILLNS
jgi:hypothetical protein